MHLRALSRAIQQLLSSAWAHSSITTQSKCSAGRNFRGPSSQAPAHTGKCSKIPFHQYCSIWVTFSSGPHSPVFVDNTTSALLRIWVMAAASLFLSSFLSSPTSLFKLPRSLFSFLASILEQSQSYTSLKMAQRMMCEQDHTLKYSQKLYRCPSGYQRWCSRCHSEPGWHPANVSVWTPVVWQGDPASGPWLCTGLTAPLNYPPPRLREHSTGPAQLQEPGYPSCWIDNIL